MKRLVNIFSITAIISLIGYLFNFPGSAMLLLISLLGLSIVFFYFSFALFFEIPFKKITNKESYIGINFNNLPLVILTGFLFSLSLIGVLFKIFEWPGFTNLLLFGAIGLLISLSFSMLFIKKPRPKPIESLIKVNYVILFTTVVMNLLPLGLLVEIRYSDYPEYVKAYKEWVNDRDNPILQERLKTEEQKMREF